MAASPTVLCNNFLKRGFEEEVQITPMKLQKLMYLTCCAYAKRTRANLLSELFEVWKHGPVLPSVYNEFRSFGSNPITAYAKDARGSSYMVSEADNPTMAKTLSEIWSKYKHHSGIELSKLTHKDGTGWSNAYQSFRTQITLEDMINDIT